MQYTNGSQVIDVSKGAYESIFKGRGYLPMKTILESEKGNQEEYEKEETQKATVKSLRAEALELGIEGCKGMNKEELLEAIEQEKALQELDGEKDDNGEGE